MYTRIELKSKHVFVSVHVSRRLTEISRQILHITLVQLATHVRIT